jgi:hypothetical protein
MIASRASCILILRSSESVSMLVMGVGCKDKELLLLTNKLAGVARQSVACRLQLRHTLRAILARRLLRTDDNKEGMRDERKG